jgi:hypothetical protein
MHSDFPSSTVRSYHVITKLSGVLSRPTPVRLVEKLAETDGVETTAV